MKRIKFEKTPFSYFEEAVFFGNIKVKWPFSTYNFYISSYVCPECGNHMVKTVFPEDLEIETEEGKMKIPRIFVCANCKTVHAPRPGYKLSRNNGFYVRLDEEDFEDFIYYLDMKGSLVGRRGTLYNENL